MTQDVYSDEGAAYDQVRDLVDAVAAKNGWLPEDLADVQADVDAAHDAATTAGFWSQPVDELVSAWWDGEDTPGDVATFWEELRGLSEGWDPDLPGTDDLRRVFGAAEVTGTDVAAQADLASPAGQLVGAAEGAAADVASTAQAARDVASAATGAASSPAFWVVLAVATGVAVIVAVKVR